MPGYIATIGAATGWLSETEENLNGSEVCKIFIPNTPTNRAIVGTDGTGTLRWTAGPVLFTGTFTGAKHAKDVLEVAVIPTAHYTMAYKVFSADYSVTPTSARTIFEAICTAAGITPSWTVVGVVPSIAVKFIKASCLDAANFIADIMSSDRYYSGTSTFVIGPRGTVKGAVEIIEDAETARVKDRKGKVDQVYVRGSDETGNYIEGKWPITPVVGKTRPFTEKKASSEATLNLLAHKYYDQLNTDDGPSSISIRLDQSQNILLGDTVTLTSSELSLSGGYRISKIVRRLDSCQISITVPNKSIEDKVLDMKKYEDFGIYVTAGVVKSMQNWSSDITIVAEDWDTASWSGPGSGGHGHIKFSDNDEQEIDADDTGNLGAAGVYFLYFTVDDSNLRVTEDYDVAVSDTTAIFAKLALKNARGREKKKFL